MNERILQLAASHFPRDGEGNICTTPEIIAEFAELIVRECADLFEVEWGDEKLTGNDVGYVVKKHFGVEK